jgi:DNA replication and repair protein RecF
LEAFEKVLAPAAAELIAQRTEGLKQLGASVAADYGQLCDTGEQAALKYEPDFEQSSAEALLARWEAGRPRDLQLRTTSTGPHRDDFALKVAGQVAKDYGSEGQQRSLVLALRLAQAACRCRGNHVAMRERQSPGSYHRRFRRPPPPELPCPIPY